jgi:hypothetical protein
VSAGAVLLSDSSGDPGFVGSAGALGDSGAVACSTVSDGCGALLTTGIVTGGTYPPMRERMIFCRRSSRAFGCAGL